MQIQDQFAWAEPIEADDLMVCAPEAVNDQSAAAFSSEGNGDRVRGLLAGHEALRFRGPNRLRLQRVQAYKLNCQSCNPRTTLSERFRPYEGDNVRIFISWSGNRSQQLAKYLDEFLGMIFESADTFLSTKDIQPGKRWGEVIASALDDINFGIICVTPENINEPWILFEAGALSKSVDEANVIPLLLEAEFKDLTGPLTQFQAHKVERDSVWRIVDALHDLSQTKRDKSVVETLFNTLWEKFEANVQSIPKDPKAAPAVHRSIDDVLEELVRRVRSIERKVGANSSQKLFPFANKLLKDQVRDERSVEDRAKEFEALKMFLSPSTIERDHMSDLFVERYRETMARVLEEKKNDQPADLNDTDAGNGKTSDDKS